MIQILQKFCRKFILEIVTWCKKVFSDNVRYLNARIHGQVSQIFTVFNSRREDQRRVPSTYLKNHDIKSDNFHNYFDYLGNPVQNKKKRTKPDLECKKCCGSVTFCYGSADPDRASDQWNWIQILLFLALTFKTPSKKLRYLFSSTFFSYFS
jgi:hypothetical protein